MNAMGQRVRARRKAMGLSLDQLAKLTASSKSYIQRLETQDMNISVEKANLVAAALNWTVDELIAGPERVNERDQLFFKRYKELNARDRGLIELLVETMWLERLKENSNAS